MKRTADRLRARAKTSPLLVQLEAFWSSEGALAPEIKVGVGCVLWLLVFGYFFLLGRGPQPEAEPWTSIT